MTHSFKQYSIRLILLLVFIQAPLLADEPIAYPENRGHSPGYESKTVTGRRLGPEEYSSKIIGTPIVVPAGATIHSVWFVMDFVLYEPGDTPEAAISEGIFRGGITSYGHFLTNPLESPLANTPNHLPGNYAYNPGAGLDESKYFAVERESISITAIDALPGFFLVGIGFATPWTAEVDTTVWAWVNVEYPDGDQLVRVYSFQDDEPGSGVDLQVNQLEEITELERTSMIWLEQGPPFDDLEPAPTPFYEMSLVGANKKVPSLAKHFKNNKVFKNNPFTLSFSVSGKLPTNQEYPVYLSIDGQRCNQAVAALTFNKNGFASLSGKGPRAPRRRKRIQFSLEDGVTSLTSVSGKLINKSYKGGRKGRLRQRKVEKLCQRLQLLQD